MLELLDTYNIALKNLASLKVSHDNLDQLLCLIHHLLVCTATRYIAIIRDVDLHTGALNDRIDRLATLSDSHHRSSADRSAWK